VPQCVDEDVIPALHCPFIFLEILHRNPGAAKPYTTDTQIAQLGVTFRKCKGSQGASEQNDLVKVSIYPSIHPFSVMKL